MGLGDKKITTSSTNQKNVEQIRNQSCYRIEEEGPGQGQEEWGK